MMSISVAPILRKRTLTEGVIAWRTRIDIAPPIAKLNPNAIHGFCAGNIIDAIIIIIAIANMTFSINS